ncbi:TPA: hypothetical protein QDZ34_002591 [Stenotrophomonas maltophilia]|nr:hypothetical protein [Stenotrophomonas maltophilia]HDS1026719.1 hypothetical protein [Stenotrophomonas maltophilia]HDS1030306.1 hypothetical protein [Stenotrophomonas maltophilia]HDS1035230.1 hypothetical protein [Stenotrophomonas maltophilia]
MTHPDYPHLHDAVGDALAELPAHVAASLEATLRAAHEHPMPGKVTLLGELKRIRGEAAGDENPWPDADLPAARRAALARADRASTGLLTVLDALQAAEHARTSGALDPAVGDSVVNGLLMASRALAAHVNTQLQPD